MPPLTVHLALGCILRFGHPDPAMTQEQGDPAEGIVYRTVTAVDAHGREHVIEAGGHGKGFSPGRIFKGGASPDHQYFAYVAIDSGGRNIATDVRFVSARRCTLEPFVKAADGAPLEPIAFEGWAAGMPHTVRSSKLQGGYEPAIPAGERHGGAAR